MRFKKISPIYKRLISVFYGSSAKKPWICSVDCCDNESMTHSKMNSALSSLSDDQTFGSHQDESVVCTLTESTLADRKNKLLKDLFSKVRNTNEIEMGYIFSFPYEERLLVIMTEYIIAEKRCCPFFNFDIKLQTNDILLEITGPKEAKKMIEMFLSEIKEKS